MRSAVIPAFYLHLARSLIRLYPFAWRERYAEEMLQTLEDMPPTLRTIINLFFHLFDAYTHIQIIKGKHAMLQKMRLSGLTIYGATLIFFAVWFIAQVPSHVSLLTMENAGLFPYTPPPFVTKIMHWFLYILLLSLLAGGLPLLLAAGYQAVRARRIGALCFCLLAFVSPVITVFVASYALEFLEGTALSGATATWLTLLIGLAGLCVDLMLIFFAILNVAPSRRVTHFALRFAVLIPIIMLIGMVALLIWIFPSLLAALQLGTMTSYVVRQIFLLLVMVGALTMTLIALKRGRQARQATQEPLREEPISMAM